MQALSSDDSKMRFIAQAEKYIDRGWYVARCVGKDPSCGGKGWNIPGATNFSATRDKTLLTKYFGGKYQLGVLCGELSGILVIDVDCDPTKNKVGWQSWLKICQICGIENPENPGTYRVRTGSGGWHFYFQYAPLKKPSGSEPNAWLFEDIDVKNDGGFVVAPPSVHPTTHREYTTCGDLEGKAILPLPPKLKGLLAPKADNQKEKHTQAQAMAVDSAALTAQMLEKYGNAQNIPKPSLPPKIEFAYDFKEADLAEAKKVGKAPQYTTGLPSLDRMLGGGWQQGEFYVLGGGTGCGKTAFALQTAEAVAKAGFKVVYFSLEVPRSALTARLISKWTWQKDGWQSGFSTRAILRGKLNEDSHAGFYESHKAILQRIAFVEGKINGVAVDFLQEYLKAFVEKFNTESPPLVIVDYLQILQSDVFGNSDKQRIDGVVYGLKQLANQFHVPLLAISSLNRASYNGILTLNSFKESGAVEYTADAVFGLELAGAEDSSSHAESKRAQYFEDLAQAFRESVEKNGEGNMRFKVLKNRNGESGVFNLKYAPRKNSFSEGSVEGCAADIKKKRGAAKKTAETEEDYAIHF